MKDFQKEDEGKQHAEEQELMQEEEDLKEEVAQEMKKMPGWMKM